MSTSKFSLHSTSFSDNGVIPVRYSAQGQEINPELQWSNAPFETRELALICEDPDAPTAEPFVHWLVYGLSANVSRIPEGLAAEKDLLYPIIARQGLNTMRKVGYLGPNPPFWHGGHRYFFRLFALSAPIELQAGATREEFDQAIEGKVLAEATLMGTYEKSQAQKWISAAKFAVPVLAVAGATAFALKKRDSRRFELF